MSTENKVLFQKDGSPYSSTFNDIYFDTKDGCKQSEQVFINNNHIKSRLISAQTKFTIAETGFGTGLNFFLTLALYQQLFTTNPENFASLSFISVEKYPLNKIQIA